LKSILAVHSLLDERQTVQRWQGEAFEGKTLLLKYCLKNGSICFEIEAQEDCVK
jgi:hypothetical protein